MSKTAVKLMQKALDRHLMDGRWRHDVTEAIALVNATKAERDELLEALSNAAERLEFMERDRGTTKDVRTNRKLAQDFSALISRIQARGSTVKE